MDGSAIKSVVYFGEFSLDPVMRKLSKNGEEIVLNPKTIDLLIFLIERRGEVLTKDELLDGVWGEKFVEENNLMVNISLLRKALDEKKGKYEYILTKPGVGYEFVAEIRNSQSLESDNEIDEISSGLPSVEKAVDPEAPISSSWFLKPALVFSLILVLLFAGFLFWKYSTGLSGSDIHKSGVGEIKFTRLTSNGKVTNATLTPDGKYLVFSQAEPDGESLRLRQIFTGSETEILPSKPVKFNGLAVSPDGSNIYCTVFTENKIESPLWRLPLLGGAIEEIPEIITNGAVSISPDGKQLVFTESNSSAKKTYLSVANADGSNKRILVKAKNDERLFPIFRASPVSWSPDGKKIATSVKVKSDDGRRSSQVIIVDPEDGSEKTIPNTNWSGLNHLAWIDNDNIAVVADSENNGVKRVWKVASETGESRPLTNNVADYEWITVSDGKLATVQRSVTSKLVIAEIDENIQKTNATEIYSHSGHIGSVSWQGEKELLFSSRASGKNEIWRIGFDGSNPTQLTNGANVGIGVDTSSDKKTIFFSRFENGKHSLWKSDGDGKNLSPLTTWDEDIWVESDAKGKTLVFQRGVGDKLLTIWKHDIEENKSYQLGEEFASNPTISPDGKRVAYYFMDNEADKKWKIGLRSTENAAFLGKISLSVPVVDRRMRWHPGGEYLSQVYNTGEEFNLFLFATDGGESKKIERIGKGTVQSFNWSEDGSKIAFSKITKTLDVLLLEGS